MKSKTTETIKIRKRPFKIHWSEEEDKILFSMVKSVKPKSWKAISKLLNKKSPSQCFYRFHSKNTIIKNKIWTKEEDDIIKNFVILHGENWEEISKILVLRSPKEIKDRFTKKLDLKLIRTKFTKQEDDKIISLYLKNGSKWSYISKFINGRNPDMIKRRFYSSLQKQILITQEDFKLDLLNKKVIKFFLKFSFFFKTI